MATINMNGKDAKVPTVYKANASYSHFFAQNFRVTASAYLSLGRNNYTYVDKNMVDEPYFRIAAEDNRGVYVPAGTINPQTDRPIGHRAAKPPKLAACCNSKALEK
jgi:hypothetical protein